MGRLNIKDRIAKFRVVTNGRCSFCDQPETVKHLFFECRITNKIWATILDWLYYITRPTNWTNEKPCKGRKKYYYNINLNVLFSCENINGIFMYLILILILITYKIVKTNKMKKKNLSTHKIINRKS